VVVAIDFNSPLPLLLFQEPENYQFSQTLVQKKKGEERKKGRKFLFSFPFLLIHRDKRHKFSVMMVF